MTTNVCIKQYIKKFHILSYHTTKQIRYEIRNIYSRLGDGTKTADRCSKKLVCRWNTIRSLARLRHIAFKLQGRRDTPRTELSCPQHRKPLNQREAFMLTVLHRLTLTKVLSCFRDLVIIHTLEHGKTDQIENTFKQHKPARRCWLSV